MRTVRYSSSFSGTRASSRRRRGSIMSRLFGPTDAPGAEPRQGRSSRCPMSAREAEAIEQALRHVGLRPLPPQASGP
jgi:hypothetical protein